MKSKLFLSFFLINSLILFVNRINAQALRSGEITTEIIPPLSNLNVSVSVVIYTEGVVPTQQYLCLYWGDGKIDSSAYLSYTSYFCNTNYYIFK